MSDIKVGTQIFDKVASTYGRVTKVSGDNITYVDRNGKSTTQSKSSLEVTYVNSSGIQEVIENGVAYAAVRLAVEGKAGIMSKAMAEMLLEDALYSLFARQYMGMVEVFKIDAVSTEDYFNTQDVFDSLNRVIGTDLIINSVVKLIMGQGVFSKSRIKEILERTVAYYLANLYNRKFQNVTSENYVPV